ncbi:MAG: heme-binding protein [Oligoflexus sp.]|nr:heme-binding protein [Pseudopedobacter sp.]
MKIIFILFGVIFLAFIAIQIFAMSSQKNIETYPYVVTKKYDTFEIRKYEATLFTSVKLSSNKYKESSSKGFSILAGYIFGGNEKNEKIAMTSPVAMSLEDSMTMMFMVPKKFNKETLPQPNQSQIKFREEPAKTVAAITFGGWADDEKIEQYKQKLKTALDAEGIKYTNRFYFFGYNPPYEVLNRKNEVIVELEGVGAVLK